MSDTAETDRLRARVTELEKERDARAALGRPPSPASSTDALLVAWVCKSLSLSRGGLAKRLSVTLGILSRANRVPLAEHHRVALRAMLADAAPEAENKGGARKGKRRQKSF